MADASNKYLFTVTYLLICFIISIPFNYANFQLLYPRDGIPAGADNTFHTYYILKILDTNNPLLSHSQFPSIIQNNSSYYPSFFHLTLATLSSIVGANQAAASEPILVVEIEKSFMFAISLVGTAGYALVIRALLYKSIAQKVSTNSDLFVASPRYRLMHLIVSALAFSIFIFSVTPIIKTYNDGSYAQIFAMWSIFPYYLYLLVNGRWISSSILLSIIASSHSLSFVMSLSATIPYLISISLQRFKDLKKNLLKFSLIFFVLSIPALIFFYAPLVTSIITTTESGDSPPGLTEPWPIEFVREQLKPGLFYLGLIFTLLSFILNYRTFGWLAGWIMIYFLVFDFSSIIGARFARELSVIFGIVIGICLGYILFYLLVSGGKWLTLFRSSLSIESLQISPLKLIVAVIICASIVPLWYLYFLDRFEAESDPLNVKYFTKTVDESNRFFLKPERVGQNSSNSSEDREVIVLFGRNPWLKVTTFGKFEVLEVQSQPTASGRDSRINDELSAILLSPDIASTDCIMQKYDVDYIYVSDILPGRYYSSDDRNNYYQQLSRFQTFAPSDVLKLEQEYIGDDQEYLRIFSINKDMLNTACD